MSIVAWIAALLITQVHGTALAAVQDSGQQGGPGIATSSETVRVAYLSGDANTTEPGTLRIGYRFTGDRAHYRMEAEKAVLSNVGTYPDAVQLSGGHAVGGFGLNRNCAATMTGVPAGSPLIVYFNNVHPAPVWCGLYVNEKRVRTLEFPSTVGKSPAVQQLRVEETMTGTVALQVDAEDFTRNAGRFIMLDRFVVGEPGAPQWLETSLGGEALQAQVGLETKTLCFETSTATGVIFRAVIRDAHGVSHVSNPIRQFRNETWEQVALIPSAFTPPLTSGTVAADQNPLAIRIENDGADTSATLTIRRIGLSPVWPSTEIAGSPFERSRDIAGVTFTGRHASYTQADTWYPTWGDDDILYSPYTDGTVDGVAAYSNNPEAVTGMAQIEGSDPMNLKVTGLGVYWSRPWPYQTRYPCGSLMFDKIWYYGTYIINGDSRPDGLKTYQGPFVGFRYSTDRGRTWTETPRTPLRNLFGEMVDKVEGGYSKIKMGSPHFVDFGRNMEHSPDGKAYLIAHGATAPDSMNTWIMGSEAYLCRVTPSIANMNDIKAYEFYAGRDTNGEPVWVSDFGRIKPLFEWTDRVGCITMTWNPGLKKYLTAVSVGTVVDAKFDTYLLESDRIEGPFRMITYMQNFGTQAYFVNFPSKFIAADGRHLWMCYAANWTGHEPNPPGSGYGLSLHEITLSTKEVSQ